MTVTVVIEPPCAFINANDTLHFREKAKLVKKWRTAAADAVNAGFFPDYYERAHITIHYRLADNRKREVSNLQPTSKAICDGIVDAQLIPDDNDQCVIGPDNRREFPNGLPRVTVTIEEIP